MRMNVISEVGGWEEALTFFKTNYRKAIAFLFYLLYHNHSFGSRSELQVCCILLDIGGLLVVHKFGT